MGWGILEINSSCSRTGKDISSLFSEATHSHSVRRFFVDDGIEISAMTVTATSCSPPQTQLASKNVALVFEEVDIDFEEDKGFLAALKALIMRSKRPVILTCNGAKL
jgi:hypothetical protein